MAGAGPTLSSQRRHHSVHVQAKCLLTLGPLLSLFVFDTRNPFLPVAADSIKSDEYWTLATCGALDY